MEVYQEGLAVSYHSSTCQEMCEVIERSGRSLEEEMATRSSVLAWKTPWTEEPDGLQSMGLQRVGHD